MNNSLIDSKGTVSNCIYNVVFCTKYCRKLFDTDEAKAEVEDAIRNHCRDNGMFLLDISVMDNVVELNIKVDPTTGIYKAIRGIKRETHKVLIHKIPNVGTRVPTIWTRKELVRTKEGSISNTEVLSFIEKQRKG